MTRIRIGTIRLVALFALLALAFAGAAEAKKDKRYKDEIFKVVASKRDIVYGQRLLRIPTTRTRRSSSTSTSRSEDKVKAAPGGRLVHGGSFCSGDKAFGTRAPARQVFRAPRLRHGLDRLPPARRRPCRLVGSSIPTGVLPGRDPGHP